MNKISDLDVLFHAYSLQTSFLSSKISSLFKLIYEDGKRNSGTNKDFVLHKKEAIINSIGLPQDEVWLAARDEIEQARDLGIVVINFLDENYPPDLLEIYDPPLVLFILTKQNISKNIWSEYPNWAIVGARNPSTYGSDIACQIGKRMVENKITVVSGLAYGIDKMSHIGALQAYSSYINNYPSTIAILGSGLLEIYPREHKYLAKNIIDSGGMIISEYGLKMTPRTFLFPRRNRIISGISKGIVIVEAKKKSGSLITARFALEHGKDLHCVPGPIDSELSEGVNLLIKEGAAVITSVDDFIKNISKTNQSTQRTQDVIDKQATLSDLEAMIINDLKSSALTFDEINDAGILDEEELRVLLTKLEFKGILKKNGNFYQLA